MRRRFGERERVKASYLEKSWPEEDQRFCIIFLGGMVASSRALAGDMATDLGVEEGGAEEDFEAALGNKEVLKRPFFHFTYVLPHNCAHCFPLHHLQ